MEWMVPCNAGTIHTGLHVDMMDDRGPPHDVRFSDHGYELQFGTHSEL